MAFWHCRIYGNRVTLTPQLDIETPAGVGLTESQTKTVNLRGQSANQPGADK